MVEVFWLAAAVGELLHPYIWRAKDIIRAYTQLLDILLELDARMKTRELVRLFTLRVHEFAEAMRGVLRGNRFGPPDFSIVSPADRKLIQNVRIRTGTAIAHAEIPYGGKGSSGWPGYREPGID